MSGIVTKYPAFQDALETALKARLEALETPVPVSLGWPAGEEPEEFVWISGTGEIERESAVSGYGQSDERLLVEVRAQAEVTTDDYKEARDRAFELAAEVERAIGADRTLGGTVTDTRVARMRTEEAVRSGSRLAGVLLEVEADATATTVD